MDRVACSDLAGIHRSAVSSGRTIYAGWPVPVTNRGCVVPCADRLAARPPGRPQRGRELKATALP